MKAKYKIGSLVKTESGDIGTITAITFRAHELTYMMEVGGVEAPISEDEIKKEYRQVTTKTAKRKVVKRVIKKPVEETEKQN